MLNILDNIIKLTNPIAEWEKKRFCDKPCAQISFSLGNGFIHLSDFDFAEIILFFLYYLTTFLLILSFVLFRLFYLFYLVACACLWWSEATPLVSRQAHATISNRVFYIKIYTFLWTLFPISYSLFSVAKSIYSFNLFWSNCLSIGFSLYSRKLSVVQCLH